MKIDVEISAESLEFRRKKIVAFTHVPSKSHQAWMGTFDGSEKEGETVVVRRQLGPNRYEYATVEVVKVHYPVTGGVVLTIEPRGLAEKP